jgi:hypothetical protein
VKRLIRMVLGLALVAAVAKRAQKARKVYMEEVASGSRPIEAVRTSVAAFVGL